MIDYFLISIALIYLILATIFDIKIKEVPDWLSFSLIAIALFTNFLYSVVFNEWDYIIFSLIGLVIALIFGSLMYYSRQWGGGDTKLLIGLCALIPMYPKTLLNYFNPSLNLPFLAILLLNILITGGIYGLLFSAGLAIKNHKKFSKEFDLLIKNYTSKLNIKFYLYYIMPVILVFILMLIFNYLLSMIFIIFIILLIFIYIFIKAVENSSMYKLINVKNLEEGDWVVNQIKIKNKIIYKPKLLGVTKQDIIKLQKSSIKKVLIKDGLPFVPAFLVGFIISIIFGNLFLLFI